MSEQQSNRVRASDSEREQVAAVLRHGMSEGRLSLAEGEERLAALYATTYRDELATFTADLPPDAEPADATGGERAGRRSGPAGRRSGPAGRRRRPRPLVGVAALAAVVGTVWVLATGGPLWPAILLGILALMLAKRARYGYRSDWHRGDWHRGHGPCGRAEPGPG